MPRDVGLFPTVYLRMLLSHRAAAPGTRVSLRVDGTDAGSLIRGKVLIFDREEGDDWHALGMIIGARSADFPSHWVPVGSAPMAVTLEGYRGTMPLFFDVPPIPAGDCRIRLDLTHSSEAVGNVRQRTTTLYAWLRVLEGQT
jgi:hypothetical protein